MKLMFIKLLFLSLFVNLNIYATNIFIKDKAVVNTKWVKLSDIADIETSNLILEDKLNNIILGRTPLVGDKCLFTKYQIIGKIRQTKILTLDINFQGSDKVKVYPPSLIIKESDIYESAKEFLLSYFELEEDEILIDMQNKLKEILVGFDPVKYQFINLSTGKFNGRAVLNLNIIQSRRIVFNTRLIFNIKVFKDVWVAKNTISKDSILSNNDLKKQKRDITKLSTLTPLTKEEIINKSSLRSIRKGTIITNKMIGNTLLIKRGNVINVEKNIANLSISVSAKALDKGYFNDIIRVQNLDTKRIITGYVKDSNTVIVR